MVFLFTFLISTDCDGFFSNPVFDRILLFSFPTDSVSVLFLFRATFFSILNPISSSGFRYSFCRNCVFNLVTPGSVISPSPCSFLNLTVFLGFISKLRVLEQISDLCSLYFQCFQYLDMILKFMY
uniref:Uncharacterized protein n=1 Tax=Cacopsylla melanoneura TaxID=428564 RepID=A0A8D8QZ11_9HEMI